MPSPPFPRTGELIGFMCCLRNGMNREGRGHLLALMLIAVTYALFWNWFFDFRFTRIKIEHSMLAIIANFGQAVTHSLHGGLRIAVLPFYLGLLGWFCRTRRGRMILFGALAWFMMLFVCYLGMGMQNRITAWKEAGQIAKYIPSEVKRQLPVFPLDSEVVLLNIPAMHKRSYVFLTGLDRALEREYPGTNIHFSTAVDPSTSDSATIFEYTQGRIVRRRRSEVLSP